MGSHCCLTDWADLIKAGTVKRVEIAVMPALTNANKVMVALNAPSKTFDLTANKFDAKFFSQIVKVTDGCNTCHDALGTTFHTPDRGGNVTVCRVCHIVKSVRDINSTAQVFNQCQPFTGALRVLALINIYPSDF